MQNKSIPELDKLFLEVGTYKKSEDYRKLFDFVKKFPHIAPYNAMLIHIQKPGSQFVASAAEWRRDFKRDIRTGARPLVILRPFGPVSFVFELGDTEGNDAFPDELLNPFKTEGDITDYKLNKIISNMSCDGIVYIEADHGTASAGFIKASDSNKKMHITRNSKDIWLKIVYEIVVNRSHEKEIKFTTILHELGHAYCGHLGTPNEKWWKERKFLNEDQMEFEAESVCWLVSERMGIKNPSAKYLSHYLDSNGEIPDISIDIILKAVGMIEKLIHGFREPRVEIIIKY